MFRHQGWHQHQQAEEKGGHDGQQEEYCLMHGDSRSTPVPGWRQHAAGDDQGGADSADRGAQIAHRGAEGHSHGFVAGTSQSQHLRGMHD